VFPEKPPCVELIIKIVIKHLLGSFLQVEFVKVSFCVRQQTLKVELLQNAELKHFAVLIHQILPLATSEMVLL